jgi:hypothetical protein
LTWNTPGKGGQGYAVKKDAAMKPRTDVITYTVFYPPGFYGDSSAQDTSAAPIAQWPPHLVHDSHATPLVNHVGAAQRTNPEGSQLLSLPEIRARIEGIREWVKNVHEAGVEIVIPYICNQTISGDPELRRGIWEFWDHWDDYADLGIGPRPTEPTDWLARERNGRPHFNYEKRHKGFLSIGQYRFAPCVNNPNYRAYQRAVVELIARVGYDGVFVDNCNLNCHCAHCQSKFRGYLASRYTREQMRDLLGFRSPDEAHLGYLGSKLEWVKNDPTFKEFLREALSAEEMKRWYETERIDEALIEEAGNGWLWRKADKYRRWVEERKMREQVEARFGVGGLDEWGIQTRQDRLLWAETKRFWAASVAADLRFVREVAAAVRGSFFIDANWGSMERLEALEFREEIAHHVEEWAPECDYIMFEEDGEQGRLAPGVYFDYSLPYRFAAASGSKALCLVYTKSDRPVMDIGHAEAAAGPGAFAHMSREHTDLTGAWRALLDSRPQLFSNLARHAQVGLCFLRRQNEMEHMAHFQAVHALSRWLSDRQLLWDVVTQGGLTCESLRRFRAVVVPEALYMSDSEAAALLAFLGSGGMLVIVGECARFDENGRKRARWPFAAALKGGSARRKGVRAAPGRSRGSPGPRDSGAARNAGYLLHAATCDDLLASSGQTLDEALQFASERALQEAQMWRERPRLVAQTDREKPIARYLEACPLSRHIRRALGESLEVADLMRAQGVRWSVFAGSEGEARVLLVHAVNYNLPLNGEQSERKIEPVSRLRARIPLPEGWMPASAELLIPGRRAKALRVKTTAGRVEFGLPQLDTYALIAIRCDTGT